MFPRLALGDAIVYAAWAFDGNSTQVASIGQCFDHLPADSDGIGQLANGDGVLLDDRGGDAEFAAIITIITIITIIIIVYACVYVRHRLIIYNHPVAAEPISFTPSANIQSIAYDPDAQQLVVAFKSGWIYRYSDVPQDIADGFGQSLSANQYLRLFVEPMFAYERVN